MEKAEQPESGIVRKQVPESDPVFAEDKERRGTYSESNIFGYDQVRKFEQGTRTYDQLVQDNAELRAELEALPDKESEQAKRIRSYILENRGKADTAMQERGKYLRNVFSQLLQRVSVADSADTTLDRANFLHNELVDMVHTPEALPHLRKLFGENFEGLDTKSLHEKILDQSVPDDLLCIFAKKHIEVMKERQTRLDGIGFEAKAHFREKVTEEVARGFLPPEAAERLPRATSAQIVLRDRLWDLESNTIGHTNGYGVISVMSDQLSPENEGKLRSALTHEMLHEASGRSINIYEKVAPSKPTIQSAYYKKWGLSLGSFQKEFSPNNWLNEAVTEWLALEMTGYNGDDKEGQEIYKGSCSYPSERRELDRLFDLGLEKDLVLRAYFEDIKSDMPADERGFYYARLVERINELEGPDGLAKLEYQFIAHRVEEALFTQNIVREQNAFEKETLPEDMEVFEVVVDAGVHKRTSQKHRYFYYARPTESPDGTVKSVDEQLEELGKFLARLTKSYGEKVEIYVNGPLKK